MNILAINPWIYDFAAYDFWLKPYGFFIILEYLKAHGASINFIDCLEKKEIIGTFGRGKYHAEIIEKPQIFEHIPRYYKRYGIKIEEFKEKLVNQHPDYILITSSMTYWYPAILETIKILREYFPKTPIILGGTYATLCFDHAKKNIPCDHVFSNDKLEDFFKLLNIPLNIETLHLAIPDYDNFYSQLEYVVFRTSWGCPFNCSYCAIKKLSPYSFRISYDKVISFVTKYAKRNIKDFVLYDDAFLYDQEYARKFLQEIARLDLNINFHTPNALHLKFLDVEIASLLKKCGFINPHFGLETLNPDLQKQWGDKVEKKDVVGGIELLKKAGFKNGEFSTYLLLGYPGQNLVELKEDVKLLHSLGAKVSFAEFSPVPGTRLFEEYKEKFSEPLLQNNSVFGSFAQSRFDELWEVKNYLRQLNKTFLNTD